MKILNKKTKKKIQKNTALSKKIQVKIKPKKTLQKTKKAVVMSKKTPSKRKNIQPYASRKNEEYMSKKQLAHFREILLQWKEHLMEDVDRTMHYMQDESSNYPDPVDRASQEEEFNLELRARDRERKLLKKIDDTLMRINDQDYGYCDDCGAEIGVRRLEARPTATQCIECKTISEIREKQVGENN